MLECTVSAKIHLAATEDGGLEAPIPSETPSLILIFESLDESVASDVSIGALISATENLNPGTSMNVSLTFWDEIGRIYATPGVKFWISYPNRIVGHGIITDVG